MSEQDLMQKIEKLHQLAQKQDVEEREEAIKELKNKAETAKTDAKKEKALAKVKALEELKGKVVFKNHEDMCNKLGWDYFDSGNSKKANLKTLEQIAEYHKEGQKIIVDIILEQPREREYHRSVGQDRGNNVYREEVCKMVGELYLGNLLNNKKIVLSMTTKDLNECVGLNEDNITNSKNEIRKSYPMLTDEEIDKETNIIVRMFTDKFNSVFWRNALSSKIFKRMGFECSEGIRIVTQNHDKYFSYVLENEELLKRYDKFMVDFPKANNIKKNRKDKNDTTYSMKYAKEEEWIKFTQEFLKLESNISEEDKKTLERLNIPIPTMETEIINSETIYGNNVNGVIKRVGKVFFISLQDVGEDIDIEKLRDKCLLSSRDLIHMRTEMIKSIKAKYEARKEFTSKDQTVVRAMDIGVKYTTYRKLDEAKWHFEQDLMYTILHYLGNKSDVDYQVKNNKYL